MARIEILLITYDVNYLMLSYFFGSMFFRVLYLLNKKDNVDFQIRKDLKI